MHCNKIDEGEQSKSYSNFIEDHMFFAFGFSPRYNSPYKEPENCKQGETEQVYIDKFFNFHLGLNNFTIALHLLVPQFESSLRRLYAAATMNDLREKQGRFTSASLSDILKDQEFEIHPGLKRLWAIIFSGGGGLGLKKDVETGLNLRNKIAHGLISDAGCNYANTFLVIHCLLQLLIVDPESAWQPFEWSDRTNDPDD